MVLFYIQNLIVLLFITSIYATQRSNWTFPDGFLFGSATSAYQIEGAWNIADKGENCWDRFSHAMANKIRDKSNGDVACDSYNKYKDDVQLIKQMGMDFYRFSMSWSRILPTGYSNVVSKDGVRYYNDLINELIKYNITPMVTLYHWDHPQIFEDMGGWTNEAMVDWFGDYARVVFREFGDRVKIFITHNEPLTVCVEGYNSGVKAPGMVLGRVGDYLCNTNLVKSHARAYHIYDQEFRAKQNGQIGIVLNTDHYFSKNKGDYLSQEVAYQFTFDRFAHPIFSKEGDFPPIFKKRISENSKFEGLERSRLPTFTKEWIEYIRGTFDFLGLNHYTSHLVEPAPKVNHTIYANDDGLAYSFDPNWPTTPSDWLRIVPEGFLNLLVRIKNTYGDVPIYITENGIADVQGKTLQDTQRLEYLYSYLKAMLTAIKEHGCNVKAYTVWSLMDNYEWDKGYTEGFGIHHVDFNHPNKTRTPKASAHWIKKVIKTRELIPPSTKLYSVSLN